jgi:hypothetical protein
MEEILVNFRSPYGLVFGITPLTLELATALSHLIIDVSDSALATLQGISGLSFTWKDFNVTSLVDVIVLEAPNAKL